jgi:large subunit ribosomal protein L35Ae
MAKAELFGKVTSFRQSKFKQDSYQTIVQMANADDAAKVIGARVLWRREDGLEIHGRVAARHGSKGSVRVRWNRGFPPQALGSLVKILP